MSSPWGWGHLKARSRALWLLLTSPHFVVITSRPNEGLRCNFNVSYDSYQWITEAIGRSVERHEAEAGIMQEVDSILKHPAP